MSKDDLTTKEKSKKDKKDSKPSSKKASSFYKELKSEYKKIVWPTKSSLKHNTGVVLAFLGLSAVLIWTLDWIFINIFALMF